jgi:hypothetical protein
MLLLSKKGHPGGHLIGFVYVLHEIYSGDQTNITLKVRCDDPARRCSCPTTQKDKDRRAVLAYSRNPKQAGGKYPYISFCPQFYGLRNLGNAIAYGSGFSNPKDRYDLDKYEGRGKP